jgi:hypothetical protein
MDSHELVLRAPRSRLTETTGDGGRKSTSVQPKERLFEPIWQALDVNDQTVYKIG